MLRPEKCETVAVGTQAPRPIRELLIRVSTGIPYHSVNSCGFAWEFISES
eukprot:COSAG02_NODE_4636_length_5143_cov_4.342585_1_plen_49_part_10